MLLKTHRFCDITTRKSIGDETAAEGHPRSSLMLPIERSADTFIFRFMFLCFRQLRAAEAIMFARCMYHCTDVSCECGLVRRAGETTTHVQRRRYYMIALSGFLLLWSWCLPLIADFTVLLLCYRETNKRPVPGLSQTRDVRHRLTALFVSRHHFFLVLSSMYRLTFIH